MAGPNTQLALLLAMLCASSAHAQDAKGTPSKVTLAASARGFFKQGLAFADKENWAKAADRFRRAMEIRHSPVLAFNLAAVLDELDEVVEAAELLHQVEEEAGRESPLAEKARQLWPSIEARFASLTVEIEGDARGATVLLDGGELSQVQIGAPIPVDPGIHVVRIERADGTSDLRQVELRRNTEALVTLAAVHVPTPEEVARAAEQTREQPATLAPPPITHHWWFWASVGAVAVTTVAAVVVIAAFGGGSSSGGDPDMNADTMTAAR